MGVYRELKITNTYYINEDLIYILVCHFYETDHIPNFKKIDILVSDITDYCQSMFLECWHSEGESRPLNEASSVPPE